MTNGEVYDLAVGTPVQVLDKATWHPGVVSEKPFISADGSVMVKVAFKGRALTVKSSYVKLR